METKRFPATAVEFDERFNSEKACRVYLMSVRWPKGFCCPRCGNAGGQFLPNVHRAASLLKRWILGTYQGSISHKHLPAYLNEFEFRFNRRRANTITLLFQRVCEFAVITHPVTYKQLVTQHVGVT